MSFFQMMYTEMPKKTIYNRQNEKKNPKNKVFINTRMDKLCYNSYNEI